MTRMARVGHIVLGTVTVLFDLYFVIWMARVVGYANFVEREFQLKVDIGPALAIILASVITGWVLLIVIAYRLLTSDVFRRNDIALLLQIFITFLPALFIVPVRDLESHVFSIVELITTMDSKCLTAPIVYRIQSLFVLGNFFLIFVLVNALSLIILPWTAARIPWTIMTLVCGFAVDIAIYTLPDEFTLSQARAYKAGGMPTQHYIVMMVAFITVGYFLMNGVYSLIAPNRWQHSVWTLGTLNGGRLLFSAESHWLVRYIGVVALTATLVALSGFPSPVIRGWSYFGENCTLRGQSGFPPLPLE